MMLNNISVMLVDNECRGIQCIIYQLKREKVLQGLICTVVAAVFIEDVCTGLTGALSLQVQQHA